ncbi:peroxiredoxin-like 2C isoform X3 [Anguilla anguilla]|uniref:peroxiredoxin-like 2C isoform X3 n=1 Tax=Anguilla anguilla TaxID=7936 RepID=UPI0015B0193E|nr:peroxiredoxin-like 2C isoform X3 [Anguilla anguilla]
MATGPVTQQIVRNQQGTQKPPANVHLSDVEDCLVYDRYGNGIPFGRLYQDKTSIIVFVKNFLCYTCKEYVEDLAKIPKKSLLSADVRLVLIGQSSHCHIEENLYHTGDEKRRGVCRISVAVSAREIQHAPGHRRQPVAGHEKPRLRFPRRPPPTGRGHHRRPGF